MEKIDLRPYYQIETQVFVEIHRFEQRRKHRRTRINKKWRKRYGYINERFRISYDMYNPKLYKKYWKTFFVEGRTLIKKSNAVQFCAIEETPKIPDWYEPPTSVNYETKTIELPKFGYVLSGLEETIKPMKIYIIEQLEQKIIEFSNSIDLEYDVLSADIIS